MHFLQHIINAIRLVVMMGRGLAARAEDKIETRIDGPLTNAEVVDYLSVAALAVPEAKDWPVSIVDLLKILHLDSRFEARNTLWGELGGDGIYAGSPKQNEWLHGQVMQEVANREFNR